MPRKENLTLLKPAPFESRLPFSPCLDTTVEKSTWRQWITARHYLRGYAQEETQRIQA